MCWLFGVSRQAYYKYYRNTGHEKRRNAIVKDMVTELRGTHPRMGGKKLYGLLSEGLCRHGIRMGRDSLFDMLREEGLLIRQRRRKAATTWSGHPFRKYRNLIKGMVPAAPNRLWVSDITYLKTAQGFVYLSLITDAYSRKIVGYDAAPNLEAVNALNALKMAIGSSGTALNNLIHHSDRGMQYCSHEYVSILNKNGINISMTENGDPRENAIAERVNGIIKNEYLLTRPIKDLAHARKLLSATVYIYNYKRPHTSCNMFTPHQIHEQQRPPKRLWKNYYKKKTNVVNLF